MCSFRYTAKWFSYIYVHMYLFFFKFCLFLVPISYEVPIVSKMRNLSPSIRQRRREKNRADYSKHWTESVFHLTWVLLSSNKKKIILLELSAVGRGENSSKKYLLNGQWRQKLSLIYSFHLVCAKCYMKLLLAFRGHPDMKKRAGEKTDCD